MNRNHADPSGASRCDRPFEESLLSGYVDRALAQGEEQRVRLHLEDCGTCRGLVDELTSMRNATMTTEFHTPSDDQWNEAPRTAGSSLTLGLGWLLLLVWLVGIAGFALGEAWQSTQSLTEKLLAFGGGLGLALLFVSVLLDRLKAFKTDRYRRIQK